MYLIICPKCKIQLNRLGRIATPPHKLFQEFRCCQACMPLLLFNDFHNYVRQLLGHRCLESTLLYTQLVSFEGDDYHVKTAKTVDDACELAKCGFEHFTTIDGIQIFRKRK